MLIRRIAILFSGSGSNMEVLLKKLHNSVYNETKIEVAMTLCNRPNAGGIEKSKKYGINPVIIDHKDFKNREDFDKKIVDEIKKYDIDLVVLAGFMRVLSPVFTKNVKSINLHPSLLPLFKGANAIKESYESDMRVAGVSVHWVSDELDGGKIIDQRSFYKDTNISFEEFEKKIHELEHELLPNVVLNLLVKK